MNDIVNDKEIEEKLKCLAEKFTKDPKQALKLHTLGRYLSKDLENKAFRAVLADPERFSVSGDFNKAVEKWMWESFNDSDIQILQKLPKRSQFIEFLDFDFEVSPEDGISVEEFLRRFLNKSIQVARDHWKKFGDFEMGTPETSAFKKYENLIRGYLFVLGVLTPDPCSQYMSGYMNKFEQQKAEAFRKMDENPSFSWKDFAILSPAMPLDIAAAILSAEIDPDVWTRRVETINNQKIKEGGDKGREIRTEKKEYKIDTMNRYFESLQKEHPGSSFKSIRDLCKEQFVGEEDHQMQEKTFFRLMKEIEKRFNNR